MTTIDELVRRFLAWKLPADFGPDGGVSFSAAYPPASPHWPSGTNLLTAQQAKDMLTHVLGDVLADADRMRWMLAGNGYFMEEEMLCGHGPCSEEEQAAARRKIDEAMRERS